MPRHQKDGNAARLYRAAQYYGRKFGSYHIATYAASASFFIITAVFPLLLVALSIISFTPLEQTEFLEMIALVLPDSFEPMLNEITADLLPSSTAVLSVSLLATAWTAAKSMLGLLDGLNAIADVNDTRNFILKRALCILYMLALIAGLLVNLGLRVFGKHILTLLEGAFPPVARVFSGIMDQKGLTLFLVITLVFVLIYTAFPNKKMKFYLQIPGAAFTSAAWLVFSELFSVYVNRIGHSSPLYGGLTMMIFVMLWLYFCMYIVFIGAVINRMCPELFWKAYVRVKRWREEKNA